MGRSPERPLEDAEIFLEIAEAIDRRYSALVLLGRFGGLRLGELLGLRRRDIRADRSHVRVKARPLPAPGWYAEPQCSQEGPTPPFPQLAVGVDRDRRRGKGETER